MRTTTISLVTLSGLLLMTGLILAGEGNLLPGVASPPSTATFHQFNQVITGDWQAYGQQFTRLQGSLVSRMYLLVLAIVPTLFFLHYIVIGAKVFDHDSEGIYYFSVITRIIHLVAAIAMCLVVLTGLMVLFGRLFGGGSLVRSARLVHIGAASVLAVDLPLMFLIWLTDMLPRTYDIAWFFVMGGYLSKEKKPVPAGKFNAGQKMWFWISTVGSGVMLYSGYRLYLLQGPVDQLRQMALLHDFLGMGLVAFFLVHLYMSLFAVKGAMGSMITGYKPREEVEILHSRYRIN